MNEPIVVKGLKNPDGTIVAEYFGKVHVDFIAVRWIDTLNAPIDLDNFKLAGLYRGVLEERNSLRGLVESNGAILFVTYYPATNKVLQFLQVKKDIYTREFDNNVWSNWEQSNYSVSDIVGLQAALDSKAAAADVTAALAGKADVEHTHTLEDIEDFDGREITSGGENEPAYVRAYTTVVGSLKRQVKAFCDRFILSIRGEEDVVISSTNLPNLVRALAVPDSTPTVDSDNLVTSGGVAAALAGKAAASHTQAISTITGLQDALNGKANVGEAVTPAGLVASLEPYQLKEDENLQTTAQTIVGAINEIRATHATVVEVDAGDGLELTDQTPFGQMYHIDNSTLAAQLDQIVTTESGNIHYHQGAGSMTADHFMIRVYRYEAEYFVEIAGAWDNIVPPQA